MKLLAAAFLLALSTSTSAFTVLKLPIGAPVNLQRVEGALGRPCERVISYTREGTKLDEQRELFDGSALSVCLTTGTFAGQPMVVVLTAYQGRLAKIKLSGDVGSWAPISAELTKRYGPPVKSTSWGARDVRYWEDSRSLLMLESLDGVAQITIWSGDL